MTVDLSGKRVLFIGIGFYDYEKAIKEKLEEFGASVTYFTDKSSWEKNIILKIIVKITSLNLVSLRNRYHDNILNKIKCETFDYVLVIKGDKLLVSYLSRLKERFSDAHFILYQWDSLVRVPTARNQFPYFDKIYSFDRVDCLNNPELNFRPLFFREQGSKKFPIKFDVSFIGLLHSDRFPFIKKIDRWCQAENLRAFFYMTTGIKFFLKNLLIGKPSYLHVRKIPYHKVTDIISSSKAVIDFSHPLQCGLTMRTIEAVGHNKKIFTTNSEILNYDFYNKKNIRIIDKDFSVINKAFIDEPYDEVPEHILKKYSLSSWVSDVFQII